MEFIIVLFFVTFIITFFTLPVKFKIKFKYYKNKLFNQTQVPFWYEGLVYEKLKECKDKHSNNIDIIDNILKVYLNDKKIVLVDKNDNNYAYIFCYNDLNEMLLLSYILYKDYNNSDTKNNGIDDFIKLVEVRKKLQSGDIDNIL